MKVLYIDTTTSDLVAAVVGQQDVTCVCAPSVGVRHSELLCAKVDEALRKAGIGFDQLDAYACAVGPGSFTGIRIGIATVKGYSMAVPHPIFAVSCLQAIARSDACGNKGSAIIDAGNGYYFADGSGKPTLIAYDDARAANAGRAGGAADYFDGAVRIIREKFAAGGSDSLEPLYIRRSQAEENRK